MEYTRRGIISILLDPNLCEVEERCDVEVALKRLRDDQQQLLSLFQQGYSVYEASLQLGIQKPYRFFRNATRRLAAILNGKVK